MASLGSLGRTAAMRPRTAVAFSTRPLSMLPVRSFHGSLPAREDKSTDESDKKSKPITFEEYKEWKSKLKNRSRLAAVPFGMMSMFAASFTFATYNPTMFDPPDPNNVELILGMDPIMASALASIVCGGVGFGLGSALQRKAWGLFNRDLSSQIAARDEDFLQRITKYRVEEHQKQDDDYYGEKIMTLADYRRWLKAQQKKRMPPDDTKLEWRKKVPGF